MRNLEFCWFAPTAGDYQCVGKLIEQPSIDYIVELARKTEELGFSHILVPVNSRCMDPFITSSSIVAATKKLKVIVACRPGMISPQVAATSLNTIDNKQSRIHVNVVQGNLFEARKQGYEFGEIKQEEERMEEFSYCLKNLLENNNSFSFKGNFYDIQDATVTPKSQLDHRPMMFIGGGNFAMRLSVQYYDYYLTFADSINTISKYIQQLNEIEEKYNRKIKKGIGVNIVARKSHEEAWQACKELISDVSREKIVRSRFHYLKTNKVAGGHNYLELKKNNFLLEDNLWLGLALARTGSVSTIFGSYDEVAEKIFNYAKLGISFFNLTGYPLKSEIEHVSEVIKRLSKNM